MATLFFSVDISLDIEFISSDIEFIFESFADSWSYSDLISLEFS